MRLKPLSIVKRDLKKSRQEKLRRHESRNMGNSGQGKSLEAKREASTHSDPRQEKRAGEKQPSISSGVIL